MSGKPAIGQATGATAGLRERALSRLVDIVGPAHAIADSDRQQPFLHELRGLYEGRAALVLRPGSTHEVSQILSVANEARIGVVPQGGNTGLVGGQTPSPDGSQVVLSLSRLTRVRDVDAAGGTMIVEAGVTLADAQAAADGADRLFPLSLPSQGSCQIGGVLATNAGGVGVLAYGNARALTLGLEVVTADGAGVGRPAHAEEGQHRLRPARSVRRLGGHARRHHGGGAEALSATGGACRRARRVAGHRRRRGAVSTGRGARACRPHRLRVHEPVHARARHAAISPVRASRCASRRPGTR